MKNKYLFTLIIQSAITLSSLSPASEADIQDITNYIEYSSSRDEKPPAHVKTRNEIKAIFVKNDAEVLLQLKHIAKTKQQLTDLLSMMVCFPGEQYVHALNAFAAIYEPSPMHNYIVQEIIHQDSVKLGFLSMNDRNKDVRLFLNQLLKKLPKDNPCILKIKDILSGEIRKVDILDFSTIGHTPEILDSSLWADEYKQWGPAYEVQLKTIQKFKEKTKEFFSLFEQENINQDTFDQGTQVMEEVQEALKDLVLYKRLEDTQEWLKLARLYKEAWDCYSTPNLRSKQEREKYEKQSNRVDTCIKLHPKETSPCISTYKECNKLLKTPYELLEGVLLIQEEEREKAKKATENSSTSH